MVIPLLPISLLPITGHNLLRKEFHGTHHLGVVHTAKGEVTDEVIDALLLERFDFFDASFRCPDDGPVDAVVAREWRFRIAPTRWSPQ